MGVDGGDRRTRCHEATRLHPGENILLKVILRKAAALAERGSDPGKRLIDDGPQSFGRYTVGRQLSVVPHGFELLH